jgi:hypothetical protein
MKQKTFTVTVDDKDIELLLRSPSLNDQKEATKYYNQAFNEALKAKAIVRAKLDDLLVEQGLWDDHKQRQFTELQNNLLDGERRLAKGGISLNEAKTIALNMKKNRDKLRDLIAVKTNLDTHTAEGQADNARFNYLVFACTVYANNNERYFKSYEDYINRAAEPAAIIAAQNLASMIYGLDSNYEEKLPENKFLLDYKFVDDKLRLVNKEGKLVDEKGRLIDDFGRFVDEDGNYVDKDGNKVDSEGDYIVEFKPFIDDNGNPVVLEKKDDTKNEDPVPQES